MAFAEAFTLHQRIATQDGDGNDVWTSGADVPIRGAFAPAGSVEMVQGQEVVISHDTLYLAPGSPTPAPTDTITARGVERQVDGSASDFGTNPFTGAVLGGPVVRLLDVTG